MNNHDKNQTLCFVRNNYIYFTKTVTRGLYYSGRYFYNRLKTYNSFSWETGDGYMNISEFKVDFDVQWVKSLTHYV